MSSRSIQVIKSEVLYSEKCIYVVNLDGFNFKTTAIKCYKEVLTFFNLLFQKNCRRIVFWVLLCRRIVRRRIVVQPV